VSVSGTIEGPGAWHIKGKLTFSILWWDISKSFDERWGTLPPAVVTRTDVGALLTAEITRAENWSTALPSASNAFVTLAPRNGDPTPIAHPFSPLTFSQTVVPLGLSLDKFGDTLVAGTRRFDVTRVTVGGEAVAAPKLVQEHFARGQFLNTTEEDKLTKPSFEEMSAGVEFSSDAFRTSSSVLSFPMEYEMVYLDIDPLKPGTTRREPALSASQPSHDLIEMLANQGAASRAPQRVDEQMRAQTTAQVSVSAPPLVVVPLDSLIAAPTVGVTEVMPKAMMLAEQQTTALDDGRTQLVELFECSQW
jgi:hypothetical protein